MRKILSINPIILSVSKALNPEDTMKLSKQIKQAVAETGDSMTVRQFYKAAIISSLSTSGDNAEIRASEAGRLADARLLEDEEHEKRQ